MSAAGFPASFFALRNLRARLARLAERRRPVDRRLLGRSAPADETVPATLGAVELRRTCAGYVACTMVKGEQDSALQTALRRLADYAGGNNQPGRAVPTSCPAVQLPGAPGTWLVRIGLPGVSTASAAPMPRSGKVRIAAQPSETLAIIRLSGRPRAAALARGEAAVRAAIAGSAWLASGPAALRLHTPSALLPWTGGFEVALSVTEV